VAEREKHLPKYDGDEVEVRVGTSASNVATAPVLTNLESISYKVDQGVTEVAVGISSRGTEVHEKLVKCTGAISRWVDELAVVSGGTGTFSHNIGAFTIGALTPLFIEIKNKTTGRKELLSNCLGNYAPDLKSPDGFLMETWDFKFNPPVTETAGT
jgi:hypothetical protein